jgi:signal transduction histidine kinase
MRTLLLELRPASLVNSDLDALIIQLSQAIQARKQIHFSINISKPLYALPTDAHIAFYRIAQEALNNIVKHAHATEVHIHLSSTPSGAELRIQDDGEGFDLDNSHIGLGLGMMGERAEAIGAALEISSGVGQGTEVRLRRTVA